MTVLRTFSAEASTSKVRSSLPFPSMLAMELSLLMCSHSFLLRLSNYSPEMNIFPISFCLVSYWLSSSSALMMVLMAALEWF